MKNKGYLYKVDNNFFLQDKRNYCFYEIPGHLGKSIENMTEKDKNLTLNKVLESKSNVINSKGRFDEELCTRLSLVLTQHCNLACKYCYAHDGTYGCKTSINMSFDTAKNSIDFFLNKFSKGIRLIHFFGGEPLLNREVLEKICIYCDELY